MEIQNVCLNTVDYLEAIIGTLDEKEEFSDDV